METGHNEYFDLPALLKLDDLNIRYIADEYVMKVGAYFNLLSKFISLAPNVQGSLKRFAHLEGDKDTYRNVDEMASLLKEIRCDRFISAFYSVLGSYETGNWRLAAHHAERISDSFDMLYSRITAAKRTVKTESMPDLDSSLKEAIKRLDDEEKNRKMVILAVDDSPVILKSVSSVLGDEYKVYTLPKPTEISKILQQLTPELFLLDYQMPELNGFDLIPIIRGFSEHADTPIIFLTSEGTIDNVTAALAYGASDFIVKPFDPDILREKIARHIIRKKLF